jgi:hypothetical protein
MKKLKINYARVVVSGFLLTFLVSILLLLGGFISMKTAYILFLICVSPLLVMLFIFAAFSPPSFFENNQDLK